MFGVLRQCASGQLLLDATASQFADPANPFAPGDSLAIGHQVDNAGKKLLLAFTSNEQLAAYHRGNPYVSLVQPATAVLKQAATEYEGIVINPGSPETLCIAYAPEIRQGLTDTPELNERLKQALAERALPWPELLDLISATEVVFVAMAETRDESGAVMGFELPTIPGKDGQFYSAVFTSPAEVWAWEPGFEAQPTSLKKIALATLETGQGGTLLNPAGPSVILNPSELQRFAS